MGPLTPPQLSCMYDSVDGLSRRHLPLEWSGGALGWSQR